jgi:uncharacterized protein (TIGR03435 family)
LPSSLEALPGEDSSNNVISNPLTLALNYGAPRRRLTHFQKKEIPMTTRSGFACTFVFGLLLASAASFGQTAASNPAFDVASVRPSPPLDMAKLAEEMRAGKMPRFGPNINASRAEYIYMSLKDLIATAYKVKPYQITGPAWLPAERFDIVAKMPEGASKDDAPRMLESLLEERFKLVAHRDTQEHPVLALVVAKDGPKLKESPVTTESVDENAPLKPGETKIDTPEGPVRITKNADGSSTINRGAKGTFTQKMDMQAQTITLESSRTTMSGFADMLTTVLQMGGGGGRQVVDKTGIKGNYQVALEISMADVMAAARAQGFNAPTIPPGGGAAGASPASAASDPNGSSTVFASVKKLGLKLEPSKAMVEQLVIDHVEKTPTEN